MTAVRPSKTSPDFLETNATSHTWIFSAIAELVDNAYDPDVKASQLHINVEEINSYECLTFTDDGNGMDEEKLDKMLSFGYSNKEEIDGHKPIGRYGNGFKSGSMRLGRDALVLTRQVDTMSVGLLSQTYLKSVNAETVLIPIVSFSTKTKKLLEENSVAAQENLRVILQWSVFSTSDDLVNSLSTVNSSFKGSKSGTKIIIYNLKTHSDSNGDLELIFDKENKDIINRSCSQDDSDYRRSLRKYCSILYLKPRMKVFLMGKKVAQRLIAKDLCKTETDFYSPKWAQEKIKITFGFNPKSRCDQDKNEYGIMVYNKNRLIQAYEKVGYQKQPNELGVGVVGVIEVDYLTPIHNKQNFNCDHKYNSLYSSLATKLNQYWDTKVGAESSSQRTSTDVVNEFIVPDCNWAMCDNCNKWRRLPVGVPQPGEEENWYCENNPDTGFNNCDIPQEPLQDDEIDVPKKKSYQKQKKKKSSSSRSNDGNVDELKQQLEVERAKHQRRVNEEKALRAKRRQCWATVERNIRALTLQTQAMMAELNSSVGDVVDEVHNNKTNAGADSERVLQCVKCQCWRLIPEQLSLESFSEPFTCSQHPNPVLRSMCVEDSSSPSSSTEPSPKRIKTEIVDEEVVDLTLDDDIADVKSEEDDQEHEELTKENDDLNAMQSRVIDLTKKMDIIRQAYVKAKSEKITTSCQTDASSAFCTTLETGSDVSMASSSQMEEENRLLRRYASEILTLVLPDTEIDETMNVIDLLKAVLEANQNDRK